MDRLTDEQLGFLIIGMAAFGLLLLVLGAMAPARPPVVHVVHRHG